MLQNALAAELRPHRRIRTARPQWLEFIYIFDVSYALIGAVLASAMAVRYSVSPAHVLLLFCVTACALFTLFWLALINCNPYPRNLARLDQLRALPDALPFTEVTARTDLSTLTYPLIFKPTLASTNSSGVQLIRSVTQATRYMAGTREAVICAQQFHAGEEFTIMWERLPWSSRGRVVHIYWRQKTHAPNEFHPLSGAGTPKHSIRANHLRTRALVETIERNVARMPNVYCTRFDVRALDAEALARGELGILESNGSVGVSGRGVVYSFCVHWPRRIVTGLYNMLTHRNARCDLPVLRERFARFREIGGWDFRISDGF